MKRQDVLDKLKINRHLLDCYNVRALYLFGSLARDDAGPRSDADLLVEFQPDARIGLFAFIRLQKTLETILSCKVDLVTPDALHTALKDRILKESIRAA